ncbi:MAG: hypothetical protein H6Q13_3342 [Bacteroidetes bacterium]|nr:hypothetical protein [Bacteroidota bacterium]
MKRFLFFISVLLTVSNLQSQNTIDSYYYDGQLIKFYNTEHYFISAYMKPINYYGDYYSIHLSILNKDITRFDFIPTHLMATYEYKKKERSGKVLTFEEYTQIVRGKQAWQETLMGLAVGFQAFANNREQIASAKIVSGGQVSHISIYDNGSDRIQNMMNDARQLEENHLNDLEIVKDGYLKRHTLFRNNELMGFINIKYHKCNKLTFTVPINNEAFTFDWEFECDESVNDKDDIYR